MPFALGRFSALFVQLVFHCSRLEPHSNDYTDWKIKILTYV